MKNYEKPNYEVIVISTEDVLATSGIVLNETNAGFNITDEVLQGAQTMNKKLLAVLALSATLIVGCSNVAKTDRI